MSSSARVYAVVLVMFFLSGLTQLGHAQALAPAPGTGDGKALDQGIAYGLMLVALLLTYLIH
ncbi:putative arabinogalactan protein/22/41 [Dioscorea sansibarensis]